MTSYTYFVRSKFRVVEMSYGVVDAARAREFDDARPVAIDVRVADVAGFAKVILQVLPAARRRKPRHFDAIARSRARSSAGGPPAASAASAAASTPAVAAAATAAAAVAIVSPAIAKWDPAATAFRAATRFDSKAMAVEFVAVARRHRVVSIARKECLGERGASRFLSACTDRRRSR